MHHRRVQDMINSARSRLLISALYLGNGALESAIVESLEDALRRNPNLCVVIVMDYARGTRGGNVCSLLQRLPVQRFMRLCM